MYKVQYNRQKFNQSSHPACLALRHILPNNLEKDSMYGTLNQLVDFISSENKVQTFISNENMFDI
jgi:hypothetical protein